MSDYGIVKAHVEKTTILTIEELRKLAYSQDIYELHENLKRTKAYALPALLITVPSIGKLHELITNKFIERVNKLVRSSGEFGEFIRHYIRKYEIENILRVLVKIRKGFPSKEIKKEIVNIAKPEIDFESFISSRNLAEAIEKLAGTIYEPSSEVANSVISGGPVIPLQFELMQRFYLELINEASKIDGFDAEIILDSLKLEVETENIFISLAPSIFGVDPDLCERLLINVSYKIPIHDLMSIIRTGNIQSILHIKPYGDIINLLLVGEDAKAKIEVYKLEYRSLKSKEVKFFVSKAYLWYILKLSEFEWRNLRSILFGVDFNMDKSELISLLIY